MELIRTYSTGSQTRFNHSTVAKNDVDQLFGLDSNFDPIDPDFFYSIFSATASDIPLQNYALEKLRNMAPSARAIFPLFDGACAAYNHLVIDTGLCICANFYASNNQGKFFINLFLAMDYPYVTSEFKTAIYDTVLRLDSNEAFSHLNLSGIVAPILNTRGLHLDLSYADLTYATLTEACLKNVDLSRATLTHAIFTRADLTYVDMTYATLYKTNLVDATLEGAKLPFAQLVYPDVITKQMVDETLLQTETFLIKKEHCIIC